MRLSRISLLLCLFTLCLATGYADEVDDRIEAAVKKLGASVVRNKGLPGEPIVSVMFSLSDCKDADLKMLTELKSLTYLALYRTGITDEGLKEVGKLTKLTTLDVMATKITDAGLKELSGLKSLEQLRLAKEHHGEEFRGLLEKGKR